MKQKIDKTQTINQFCIYDVVFYENSNGKNYIAVDESEIKDAEIPVAEAVEEPAPLTKKEKKAAVFLNCL